MSQTLDILINQCDQLIESYKEYFEFLKKENGWLSGDPRLGIIGLAGNNLISHLIQLSSLKTIILEKDWLKNHLKQNSNSVIQKCVDEYVTHSKAGLYIYFMGGVESNLRRIYSLIFGKHPPDNFYTVYSDILKFIDLEHLKPLFNFSSTLRNLIHSNGVYTKDNKSIVFKGVSYDFTNGGLINFIKQEVIFDIYEELLGTMKQILEKEKIKNLKYAA